MPAILVTGGAGFVGLNLIETLLARGEHVVAFSQEAALPETAAIAFHALPGRLDVIAGDVTDTAALRGVFRERTIDRVFPFAAITAGPAREAKTPSRIVEVNLQGMIATLEAARDAGTVRRIILPSSAAVYGESAYAHALLDEELTPCLPISLYGVTKYAVERAGLRLAGLWGLDAIAARIGATFGPWERDTGVRDTLSPHLTMMGLALRRAEAILPPSPLPSYDWVYVRDLARGLIALLDDPAPPHRVVNLASGLDWSPLIGACADVLADAFPGFRWRRASAPEEGTVRFPETRARGVMKISRAARFGWNNGFAPQAAYADYAAWARTQGAAITD